MDLLLKGQFQNALMDNLTSLMEGKLPDQTAGVGLDLLDKNAILANTLSSEY